jgi:hypothetical protein
VATPWVPGLAMITVKLGAILRPLARLPPSPRYLFRFRCGSITEPPQVGVPEGR